MKYCATCGYRLPDFERECPLCGGKLTRQKAEEAPPLHTHKEAGEQCVLPNQEETPRASKTPFQPRRAQVPPRKVVMLVLAVFFGINAFSSLLGIAAGGAAALFGLVANVLLASLFLDLSRVPPGSRTLKMRNGREVSVATLVWTRVAGAVIAFLLMLDM